jgi:hypothetical protein
MCMYVCMYVCMCVYVCMNVCVCMYVCMHACMLVCMYVCMCLCMYACMCACMYACMYVCLSPPTGCNTKLKLVFVINIRKCGEVKILNKIIIQNTMHGKKNGEWLLWLSETSIVSTSPVYTKVQFDLQKSNKIGPLFYTNIRSVSSYRRKNTDESISRVVF